MTVMRAAWSRRPQAAAVRRAAAPAAAVAAAFLLAAAAALSPIAAAALVVGAGFVALTWMRPKAAMAVIFVVALWASQLQAVGGQAGGILDEGLLFLALVLVVVRRAVLEKSVVWLPGTGWFLLFALAGVLGAILYGSPLAIVAQGAVLLLKCVAFAFTLAQLHWSAADLHRLARGGMVVAVLLALCGLVNLAIPGIWNPLFGGNSGEYVGGLPALIGPFRLPGAFGRLLVMLAASILIYQLFVRSSLFGWIMAAALSGFALLTFRVKAFVGLVIVLAGIVLRSGRPVLLLALAVLIPPALIVVGTDVFLYVFSDVALYYGGVSARSLLTAGGFAIAQAHFPLGVGFGRYGGATAADYYSPEYTRLGFERVYGLGSAEGAGAYLNDTQWPALLGETGWLGTIAFVIGSLLALRILLLRTAPDEQPIVRWMRFSGVAWFVLVMLDSIAAPVFSSPPSYLFVFAAAGIIASVRRDLHAADAGRGLRSRDLPPPVAGREPRVNTPAPSLKRVDATLEKAPRTAGGLPSPAQRGTGKAVS